MEAMKYSEHMKRLDEIHSKLQHSEDVDEAIKLFEQGEEHIKHCKERIAKAQGTFEKLNASKE